MTSLRGLDASSKTRFYHANWKRIFPGRKCCTVSASRSAAAFTPKYRNKYSYRRKGKRPSGGDTGAMLDFATKLPHRRFAVQGLSFSCKYSRAKEGWKPLVSTGVFWYFLSLLTKSARRRHVSSPLPAFRNYNSKPQISPKTLVFWGKYYSNIPLAAIDTKSPSATMIWSTKAMLMVASACWICSVICRSSSEGSATPLG